MPLEPATPVWPDSPGLRTESHLALERGDVANATLLTMDVHSGTHVDAPLHFVSGGASVDALGLDPFVGAAWVADATGHAALDAAALDSLAVPDGVRRLLLRTDNSLDAELREGPFRERYVALTPDGASWVVDRGIGAIGIDYLSIQRFEDPPDVHVTLLNAGTAIIEGLDLRDASPGAWTLICLPLRLVGREAAPARALLVGEEDRG